MSFVESEDQNEEQNVNDEEVNICRLVCGLSIRVMLLSLITA
jgi:hypothetical protein